MPRGLIDRTESLERQNERLLEITAALMRRVEGHSGATTAGYAHFERAVVLEEQVRQRTKELQTALRLLNESNAKISAAMKETEEARRDLSSAIEAVDEGFALFGPDDTLLLFNAQFSRMLPDVRADLCVGMTFREYIACVGRSRNLTLDSHEARRDWIAARLRQHRNASVFFNLALRGDQWLQISEQRTSNAGTAIVQTDVTDLIRAERIERTKLLDGQARMIRATLEHLNQGVAIFDPSTRLIGWNERLQELTRLPASVCQLGTTFVRIAEHLAQTFSMHSAEEERRLGMWVRGQIPPDPFAFEIARGSEAVLDVFMQRLPEGGFVISFSDVTREREATRTLARAKTTLEHRVRERTEELHEALKAANRSNAAKTRFVAAASHDLLQPLSAAKLYLAGIGRSDPHDRRAVEKAELALTSVEEIIGALLDISRLDTLDSAFELSPVPLADVMAPVISALAPNAAAKGLELTYVPSSAVVMSDPSYLARILQNLVCNAIRYTETGRVLVGARRRSGVIALSVIDTGPGISLADQARIFEEFTRLEQRASASEGMGLGLAIVERACASLGHRLELTSTVGRGSRFTVSLELAAYGVGTVGRSVSHPGRSRRLEEAGLIVLLVDNDHELRSALATLLETWGVHAIEVAGAKEALNLIDDLGILPDALLLDQQLDAGETGLALAEAFHARHGKVPTRIISADRSDALSEACATAGLTLMPKPLDTNALWSFLDATAAART
ncbi:MAG: PAS-domain containing protein [Pseudomonadota bacterium]